MRSSWFEFDRDGQKFYGGGGGGGSNPATSFSPYAGMQALGAGSDLANITKDDIRPWMRNFMQPFAANTSNELKAGGESVWNLAQDPQNALYARTAGQTMDQVNSANARAGLAGTPVGAATAGNAMSNFNIDWQNNLLNRQTTGLGAMSNAFGMGGNLLSQVPQGWATGAQPEEAALQGFVQLENIASNAQTEQNKLAQQSQQAGMSNMMQGASQLGGMLGK